MTDDNVVVLEAWTGPFASDDPDANFKAEIALYAKLDPLRTIAALASNLNVPVGALVHYVLAKWATEGSGGLLELGPHMVTRLNQVCLDAEEAGTDFARLEAFEKLKQMLSWLSLPLRSTEGYE